MALFSAAVRGGALEERVGRERGGGCVAICGRECWRRAGAARSSVRGAGGRGCGYECVGRVGRDGAPGSVPVVAQGPVLVVRREEVRGFHGESVREGSAAARRRGEGGEREDTAGQRGEWGRGGEGRPARGAGAGHRAKARSARRVGGIGGVAGGCEGRARRGARVARVGGRWRGARGGERQFGPVRARGGRAQHPTRLQGVQGGLRDVPQVGAGGGAGRVRGRARGAARGSARRGIGAGSGRWWAGARAA
jgi:hypothetical protein